MGNLLNRVLRWLGGEDKKCPLHGKTFAQHTDSEKEQDARDEIRAALAHFPF